MPEDVDFSSFGRELKRCYGCGRISCRTKHRGSVKWRGPRPMTDAECAEAARIIRAIAGGW